MSKRLRALLSGVFIAIAIGGIVFYIAGSRVKTTMTIGSTPLTEDNAWQTVTVENMADRNGPALKRIGVIGGWLYITETMYGHEPPTPVFIAADRNEP